LNFFYCAFWEVNQLHHVCQILGSHVQILTDMGVAANALRYACRDCLPTLHPELQQLQQNRNEGATNRGAGGVDDSVTNGGANVGESDGVNEDSNGVNNGGSNQYWYLLENLHQVDVIVEDEEMESALLFLQGEGSSAINTFKRYVETDGNSKNFHPWLWG
jgi:hypothetical protein